MQEKLFELPPIEMNLSADIIKTEEEIVYAGSTFYRSLEAFVFVGRTGSCDLNLSYNGSFLAVKTNCYVTFAVGRCSQSEFLGTFAEIDAT